jgi:tRNA pseudouridine65 synthase
MESTSELPRLVFEDESCWGVDKPPGWFVHPSPLDPKAPNLLDWLRATHESDAWVLHRLDRPTRGLVLFARSREAASNLSREFRERSVRKVYLCIARGWLPDELWVDRPLEDEDSGQKQEARTALHCLERFELPWARGEHLTTRYSLVRAEPETGRFHQIRRHLAGVSHPLVGDTRHGEGWHNRRFREAFGFHELALFAQSLELSRGTIRLPLPDGWERLLASLRRGGEGTLQPSNSTKVAPVPPKP